MKVWSAMLVSALMAGSLSFIAKEAAETELRPVSAPQEGLVGYWDFEEGAGDVAYDKSGNNNHGKLIGDESGQYKPTWVKGPWGTALEFKYNLPNYVDCGAAESVDISKGGTVMVWVKVADPPDGGIVCWTTSTRWEDARLVLGVYTYGGGDSTILVLADGKGFEGPPGAFKTLRGEWSHLAFTFDGKKIITYQDGIQTTASRQAYIPAIKDVPLWFGRSMGLSRNWDRFNGMIDEVYIYNRPLSLFEIRSYYKQTAPLRGKDVTFFNRPILETVLYPGNGKVFLLVDFRAMQPIAEGSRIRATLLKAGSKRPVREVQITEFPPTGVAEAMFDMQGLKPGTYSVRAQLLTHDGARIGDEASTSFNWAGQPKAFKKIKVLNNLCWELLNVKGNIVKNQMFTLPIDRWVFVRSTAIVRDDGEVRVVINTDDAVIEHRKKGKSTLEAMRYLKAGEHSIRVMANKGSKLTHLVVRAVPALHYAYYNNPGDFSVPRGGGYGPYVWEFVWKHGVLANCNVMVNAGISPQPEHIQAWKKMGRQWIQLAYGCPFGDAPDAADKVYEHLASNPGYQHPLMDGVIYDEFHSGSGRIYENWRQAVEKLNANFRGKSFSGYGADRSAGNLEVMREAIRGGGYVCPYNYIAEEPTEEAARQRILATMVQETIQWQKALGGIDRVVFVLGLQCQPNENYNVDPSVNFLAFRDMRYQIIATHPAFFGLGGIQEYHTHRSDEENLLMVGQFYRHYCLEGNTKPLIKDPYKLTHIQNPDFAEGTRGWRLEPAERDSIQPRTHDGYGRLHGRAHTVRGVGDTFLWTRRSAKAPNRFSQDIKNLIPGRLYSMKMITSDYQDLIQERSAKKQSDISIKLENADVLPERHHSFQAAFVHPGGWLTVGKFNINHRYWMTYHWQVFRAKGKTAKLTVSDWKSAQEPGGSIGQELMFNFIEIQPYYGRN